MRPRAGAATADELPPPATLLSPSRARRERRAAGVLLEHARPRADASHARVASAAAVTVKRGRGRSCRHSHVRVASARRKGHLDGHLTGPLLPIITLPNLQMPQLLQQQVIAGVKGDRSVRAELLKEIPMTMVKP